MRLHVAVVAIVVLAACAPQAAVRPSALKYELPELRQYLPQPPPAVAILAPGMPKRQEVLQRAAGLLGTPYVWGGNGTNGLDCSAYASLALATASRHTTDTFLYVSTVIEREELLPGDLLNFETWEHPTKSGHVRIFAAWADQDHSKMWVFESRYPQGAVYHVVTYDRRYSPLRYDPLFAEPGKAALIAPTGEGASSP
jgi:hypothetical protein